MSDLVHDRGAHLVDQFVFGLAALLDWLLKNNDSVRQRVGVPEAAVSLRDPLIQTKQCEPGCDAALAQPPLRGPALDNDVKVGKAFTEISREALDRPPYQSFKTEAGDLNHRL
jgi:hypothetical protein